MQYIVKMFDTKISLDKEFCLFALVLIKYIFLQLKFKHAH